MHQCRALKKLQIREITYFSSTGTSLSSRKKTILLPDKENKIIKKKKIPTWEFNEDRTLKSLYWLDDSLVSFAEVVETSYMNTMSSYLSWVTNMNPIWITHNIYFIVAIQSHIVQDHRPLHPFSIEFGLDAPNLYEILHWKNPGTTIQVFFAGFQSDFKR